MSFNPYTACSFACSHCGDELEFDDPESREAYFDEIGKICEDCLAIQCGWCGEVDETTALVIHPRCPNYPSATCSTCLAEFQSTRYVYGAYVAFTDSQNVTSHHYFGSLDNEHFYELSRLPRGEDADAIAEIATPRRDGQRVTACISFTRDYLAVAGARFLYAAEAE